MLISMLCGKLCLGEGVVGVESRDFWRGFNTGGIQSLIFAAKAGDGKMGEVFHE